MRFVGAPTRTHAEALTGQYVLMGAGELEGEMSQAAAVDNYRLLFSRRELKKTSMVYFPSEEDD